MIKELYYTLDLQENDFSTLAVINLYKIKNDKIVLISEIPYDLYSNSTAVQDIEAHITEWDDDQDITYTFRKL